MIRVFKFLFLAVLAIGFAIVATANRGGVTLTLLPQGLIDAMPSWLANLITPINTYELPLFVVILLAVTAGVLIGFFWVWLRSLRHGHQTRKRDTQVRDLKREVKRLRVKAGEDQDEVITLLEESQKKAS